jgi:tetratricopeptide (TPR) repeat protein
MNQSFNLVRKAVPVFDELKTVPTVQQGRSIVVVIGIDKYDRWPHLKNAVKDACGFETVLREKFKFETPIKPILNEKATKNAIDSLVTDDLGQKLQKEDSLVLFFAGHGLAYTDDSSNAGYIIPVDARRENRGDFIRINHWLENIAELPAKHILVVLDSCHSGFALGKAATSFRGDSNFQYHGDLSSRKSRKVITSALHNQLAQDSGPIEGHSLFTGILINGLKGNYADINKDGIITTSELGLFIQQKVSAESKNTQTPDFGSFYLDDRGEMIFILQEEDENSLLKKALELYRSDKLDDAISTIKQGVELNPKNKLFHLRLGDMLYKKGRMDDAIKAYQTGLDLGVEDADAAVYSHVGFIFYTLKRFDEAIKACKQAISIDPKMSEAYVCLGAAFHQQGRLEEAVLNYKQAIKINTDSFEAHLRLGQVLFDQKKLDEAVTELQKTSRIDPNQPAVWCHLGIVFYEKGDNVSAVKNLQKAIPLLIKNKETQQAEKIQSFVNQIKAEKN